MKPLLFGCFIVLLSGRVIGSSDAVAPVGKIELTIAERFSKKPASIVVEYSPIGRHYGDIISITVNWRGSIVLIPRNELIGLPKIQIDTMKLKHGAYADGTEYHYLETLFGDPEEDSADGFKQVRLLMQGDKFIERRTYITLQTGPRSYNLKPLTHKMKGKPEFVTNTHSEQDSADKPATVPKPKAEDIQNPQLESKVRCQ